jgi:hypothetical protein
MMGFHAWWHSVLPEGFGAGPFPAFTVANAHREGRFRRDASIPTRAGAVIHPPLALCSISSDWISRSVVRHSASPVYRTSRRAMQAGGAAVHAPVCCGTTARRAAIGEQKKAPRHWDARLSSFSLRGIQHFWKSRATLLRMSRLKRFHAPDGIRCFRKTEYEVVVKVTEGGFPCLIGIRCFRKA